MDESKHTPVARVAEVHMSRYTIEWTNGALPEGTDLYAPDLAAEVERLRAEAASFHMDYRMKCDEETKRLHVELDAERRKVEALREALRFYAQREHFALSDANAWDTVSGEPQNYWCDDAGTATVEDGATARAALASIAEGA